MCLWIYCGFDLEVSPAFIRSEPLGKQVSVSAWFFLLCSEEEDVDLLQPAESPGHIQLENQSVYVWSPLAGECSVSCGRGEILQWCKKTLPGCTWAQNLRTPGSWLFPLYRSMCMWSCDHSLFCISNRDKEAWLQMGNGWLLLSARVGKMGGMGMPGQFSCLTDKDMSDTTFVTMCLFSNLACMPCGSVFFLFPFF